jgi:adenylate cyclase
MEVGLADVLASPRVGYPSYYQFQDFRKKLTKSNQIVYKHRILYIICPEAVLNSLNRILLSIQRCIILMPDKPSVAVLPFENMSGDSEQEYFSDGITVAICDFA